MTAAFAQNETLRRIVKIYRLLNADPNISTDTIAANWNNPFYRYDGQIRTKTGKVVKHVPSGHFLEFLGPEQPEYSAGSESCLVVSSAPVGSDGLVLFVVGIERDFQVGSNLTVVPFKPAVAHWLYEPE